MASDGKKLDKLFSSEDTTIGDISKIDYALTSDTDREYLKELSDADRKFIDELYDKPKGVSESIINKGVSAIFKLFCIYLTFVINLNFCTPKPHHRKAPKR